jgi:hypothetical protein
VISNHLALTDHAINEIIDRVHSEGLRLSLEVRQGEATVLQALLELRRHQLAQTCPTCEGNGMTHEHRPYTNGVGGTLTVTIPCPNKAHHL